MKQPCAADASVVRAMSRPSFLAFSSLSSFHLAVRDCWIPENGLSCCCAMLAGAWLWAGREGRGALDNQGKGGGGAARAHKGTGRGGELGSGTGTGVLRDPWPRLSRRRCVPAQAGPSPPSDGSQTCCYMQGKRTRGGGSCNDLGGA